MWSFKETDFSTFTSYKFCISCNSDSETLEDQLYSRKGTHLCRARIFSLELFEKWKKKQGYDYQLIVLSVILNSSYQIHVDEKNHLKFKLELRNWKNLISGQGGICCMTCTQKNWWQFCTNELVGWLVGEDRLTLSSWSVWDSGTYNPF